MSEEADTTPPGNPETSPSSETPPSPPIEAEEAVPSATSTSTAPLASATASMWGWFEKASEQAKGLKEIAQAKATVLAKQASELRQNYDIQIASDMLMQGMGGSAMGARGEAVPNDTDSAVAKKSETPLDVHYITENILTMSFPYTARTKPRGLKTWNDLDKVAEFLNEKHKGRYMIWNVSEDPYDYSAFDNQVLEYKFPGHPAPPLGLLFKICAAIESWLDADKNNVAVVHCLTGKGRTGSILACVLAWIGEFSSPLEALSYVANRRGVTVEELTIPSQRRYVQYFSNVLDGVKPRSDPLLLRRVIMNTIPRLGAAKDGSVEGCCPYLQIFKNGTLIANSYIPSKNTKQAAESGDKAPIELKWISTNEGSLSFHMDVMIHGDVLIRCRHMDLNNGSRESMFRAAFHTGYTPIGVLRLTKMQLDGCDADDRFDDDFFVDFIFAPVEKKDSSGKNVSLSTDTSGEQSSDGGKPSVQGKSEASDSGLVVDSDVASRFDEMLHRDGRFWDKIAMRKNRATSNDSKKRKSRKFATSNNEVFSIGDESFDTDAVSRLASSKLVADMYDDSSFLVDEKSASVYSVTAVHATATNASDLSDLDLIMQLAQAEEDDYSTMSAPPTTTKADTSAPVPVTSADSAADDFLDSLSQDSPVVVSPPDAADTTTSMSGATNELMALEDFERELGLMSGGTTAPKASSGDANSKQDSVDAFDDNLDELEKYLESLGSS